MSLAQSNMTTIRLMDKDDVETQNVAIDWNRWIINRNSMQIFNTKWSNYMKVENLKVNILKRLRTKKFCSSRMKVGVAKTESSRSYVMRKNDAATNFSGTNFILYQIVKLMSPNTQKLRDRINSISNSKHVRNDSEFACEPIRNSVQYVLSLSDKSVSASVFNFDNDIRSMKSKLQCQKFKASNCRNTLNLFQTEAALIRDAVLTLAKSFKGNRTFIENLNPPNFRCSFSNDKQNPTEYSVWENGRIIMENIDKVRNEMSLNVHLKLDVKMLQLIFSLYSTVQLV